jgi:hypothetical protein
MDFYIEANVLIFIDAKIFRTPWLWGRGGSKKGGQLQK